MADKDKLAGTYILVTRVNNCSALVENSKCFVFYFPIPSKKESKEIKAILSELYS